MLKSQIRRYSLAVLGASQGGEAGQKVEKLGSKRQCPKGKEAATYVQVRKTALPLEARGTLLMTTPRHSWETMKAN